MRMPKIRAISLTFLYLLGTVGQVAHANPPIVAGFSGPQTLYLELLINGDDRQSVIKLIKNGNEILASSSDLRRAGIIPDGWATNAKGLIVLSAVKTIQLTIDMPRQIVNFKVSPEILASNIIALHRQTTPNYTPSSYDTGAYLNYDASAFDAQGIGQLAGQFGLNGFSPYGDLRTEFQTYLQSKAQPGSAAAFNRLGSAYEFDWPNIPRSFIAGDFISDSLPWTRPQLLGGIQLETNYSLQPGAITFPLPNVGGTLAVPSAVNLLVNNAANYHSNEQAGPFSMVGIPVLTGLNEITVQTRAPNGQIISTTVPFYASANLLKPGLSAYALNFGALRHNYGATNDGYANWAGSGTIRHGLTNHLTIDLHAEGAGNVQMTGVSLDTTSLLGEIDGTLAASNRQGHHAGLAAANWTRTARVVSFSLGATYAQNGFADLGTDLNVIYPHFSWYGSASATLPGHFGSLSVAYTSQQVDQHSQSQFLIGSYSANTYFGVTLSASVFAGQSSNNGLSSPNRGFELYFNIPLGRNISAEADAQGGGGQKTNIGETISRQVDTDGGYGWSFANANGQYNNQSALGELDTHEGNFTANLQRYNGQMSVQATASGSVVLLDGLHLSSPTYQSFGIVNVGYPNIPVYLENRPIGTTGSNGTLLIQDLLPYQPNKISIDATKLPMSVNLYNQNTLLTPPLNGGVVAQFPLNRNRYQVLVIETAKGTHPAPGSLLELDGNAAPLVIGYDGEVEIENPGSAISGKVIMKGQTCRIYGKLLPQAHVNNLKGTIFKCL